jgi:cell division transport system ATP-binding protein
MLFLTGMSGAGKTTLLKLICGMEYPDKGLIEVAGKDMNRIKAKEIPSFRQQIGMAYQDFKLLADRTVAQNIAMAMEVAYHNMRTIKNRVIELLQKLRLEHKHDALAGKLSRGEQQRVAIARAVANSPTLILADEPTGNLDSKTTKLVMELFEDCNNSGTTVIIATHDEDIYRDANHRMLVLHSGRLVQQDDKATTTLNNMP